MNNPNLLKKRNQGILFIVPPLEKGSFNGFPLGICSIISTLKKNGFDKVYGIDLSIDSMERLKELLELCDIAAIQTYTKTFSASVKIAKLIKSINNKIITISGGAHPTLLPEEVLKTNVFDFVIRGDGEIPMLKLLRYFNDKNSIDNVPGLGYIENCTFKIQDSYFHPVLDEYPFPDHIVFPLTQYGEKVSGIPIIATRSCPYNCSNCMPALKKIAGQFRMRSVDNVISEIEKLYSHYKDRYSHFFFFDSDLSVNINWLEQFCDGYIKVGIPNSWSASIRVNTINEKLLDKMKSAGCTEIMLGIESGAQRVIDDVLKKGIKLDKAKKIVEYADKIGLLVHTYFIIGIPGESKEEIVKTLEYAISLKNAYSISFTIGDPQPYTGFWYMTKENNWLLSDSWDDLENPYGKIMFKTDDWDPNYIEYVKKKLLNDFEKANWWVERKKYYIRIAVFNFDKFVCRKTGWLFVRFLLGEFKRFIYEFRLRRLYNIFLALKFKYFSFKNKA